MQLVGSIPGFNPQNQRWKCGIQSPHFFSFLGRCELTTNVLHHITLWQYWWHLKYFQVITLSLPSIVPWVVVLSCENVPCALCFHYYPLLMEHESCHGWHTSRRCGCAPIHLTYGLTKTWISCHFHMLWNSSPLTLNVLIHLVHVAKLFSRVCMPCL